MRRRRIVIVVVLTILGAVIALFAWPSPVTPQRWDAPPSTPIAAPLIIRVDGSSPAPVSLDGRRGPETIARLDDGSLVTGTASGEILRIDHDGNAVTVIANTGGRPLGIVVDRDGALIVADAARGVLRITLDGAVRSLVDADTPMPDGVPLGFANSVAIVRDNAIVFTDATSRFAPRDLGLDDAVFLDLLEHGGYGRVVRVDPHDGSLRILRDGLHFPNGIALSHDGRSLLVVETGMYRVLRLHVDGPQAGEIEELLANLPSFPDNITPSDDGHHWIGLVTARSVIFDRLAPWPSLRRPLAHLPRRWRGTPQSRGTAIAIDESGRIVAELVDDTGAFPNVTAVLEADGTLYIGTLDAPTIGRAGVHSHSRGEAEPNRHRP